MDHNDEQQNELSALEAIYADEFQLTSSEIPRTFELVLVPNADGQDNHISLRLFVEYPPTYPEIAPVIRMRSEKGLVERQMRELDGILQEKLITSVGEVAIWTIAEALKEYLVEHNKPEMSMHEQMEARVQQRDTEEEERLAKRAALEERIEKRKQEPSPLGIEPGTLLTPETFAHWRMLFDEEQRLIREARDAAKPQQTRLTGKQLFQQNLAKDLDEADAEKLVEEVVEVQEKPTYFDPSLYADDEDGDGAEAKDYAVDDEDDDDDADADELQSMFDTTTPAQAAVAASSSSSSSSSATKPVAASSASSSSSSSSTTRLPPGMAKPSPSTSVSAASATKPTAAAPSSSSIKPAPSPAATKPTAATPASSSSSSKPTSSQPQPQKSGAPNQSGAKGKDSSNSKGGGDKKPGGDKGGAKGKDAPKQQQKGKK